MTAVRKSQKLKSKAARSVLKQMSGAGEPEVTETNYTSTLMAYLNHHAANTDISTIRKWVFSYFKKEKMTKEAKQLKQATDLELRQLGLLLRIKTNGWYLPASDEKRVEKIITDLMKKYKPVRTKKTKDEPEKKVVSIQDRIAALASTHIGVIEGKIDAYLESGEMFSMTKYIAEETLSTAVTKKIGQWFASLRNELQESVEGKDKQLEEGYSFLGKIKRRRFLKFVDQIVIDCEQQSKTVRKPRARKVKTPKQLVASVKYMTEFEERKFKSESPENMVESKEVWLYDTKYKKLMRYVASVYDKITVKGSTLQNFDVSKSECKRIRKEDDLFKGNFTKKYLNDTYKAQKTKPSKVTGRINENIIILKVF